MPHCRRVAHLVLCTFVTEFWDNVRDDEGMVAGTYAPADSEYDGENDWWECVNLKAVGPVTVLKGPEVEVETGITWVQVDDDSIDAAVKAAVEEEEREDMCANTASLFSGSMTQPKKKGAKRTREDKGGGREEEKEEASEDTREAGEKKDKKKKKKKVARIEESYSD